MIGFLPNGVLRSRMVQWQATLAEECMFVLFVAAAVIDDLFVTYFIPRSGGNFLDAQRY